MPQPKAVIAEDEPLLRAELKDSGQPLAELVICEEAEDGLSTLHAIEQHSPDILFLDIQMPGMSGLEVARLAAQHVPRGFRNCIRQICDCRLRARRRRLRDETVLARATRNDHRAAEGKGREPSRPISKACCKHCSRQPPPRNICAG